MAPLSASSHSGSPRTDAANASSSSYGELQPVGGGDPIPLLKETLIVGRRESSDIVLRFPNVSGTHCELSLVDGHWVVKDLGSSNGTKVNGTRVSEGRVEPGDRLSIGRHEYEVCYTPGAAGAGNGAGFGAPLRDIFSRSLLAAAGLENRRTPKPGRSRS
jgi:adenylate cyclase